MLRSCPDAFSTAVNALSGKLRRHAVAANLVDGVAARVQRATSRLGL